MDKFLSFMGIIRKSGNLVLGFERVLEGVKNSEICLVMKAKDFKNKDIKKIKEIADREGIKYLELDYCMDDINSATGRYSGIIGIKDIGCAERFIKLLTEINGEEMKVWL